jgi:D-tyrosyl-tRNA(Tyr) deacylase
LRAVLQRVGRCSVSVEGREIGRIDAGLLVYLGVGREDTPTDAVLIVDKILNTRIFPDAAGKMNLSVKDAGGQVLVVSQFTLYGDVREGRRPSFTAAAEPGKARALYESVISELGSRGVVAEQGEFAAKMSVTYTNEGPVTILVDTEKRF